MIRNGLVGGLLLAGLAIFAPGAAQGQESAAPAEIAADAPPEERLFQRLGMVGKLARRFGNWDDEAQMAQNAAEAMFERFGWDSEADGFALEVMHAVNAVPPWELRQRFDVVTELLAERYQLDDEQVGAFRRVMAEEATRVVERNLRHLLPTVAEVIHLRTNGEAITPEHVQRWSASLEPVFSDIRASTQAGARRLGEQLRPEQREWMQQDLQATMGRLEGIRTATARWRNGEWSAEEWGLQNDPVQAGRFTAGEVQAARAARSASNEPGEGESAAETIAAAPSGADAAAPPPTRESARNQAQGGRPAARGDNDPWAEHVRSFISRYQLTNEQQATAWRVHESLAAQRDELQRRRAAVGGKPAGRGAAVVETRLFEQLKRRLERIPTRAQRAKSEAPAAPPVPSAQP